MSLYVKLCYAECDTDLVPIAGQACVPDEFARAPSRTLESFRIDFAWERPPQARWDAIHAFSDLMSQVELIPDGASPPQGDTGALLDAVRSIGLEETSPPAASPPSTGPFAIPQSLACAALQDALTVWITEVSPRFMPDACEDDCILLACIGVTLDASAISSSAWTRKGT